MKYLSQLKGFWNWRRTNELSHAQVDLYMAILECANTTGWKPHFNIPNTTLLGMCQLSSSDLHRQRAVLIQKCLIEYKKGKKGSAGHYKINPLYGTDIDTNNSDEDINPAYGINPGTNTGINPGNIHKTRLDKTRLDKEVLLHEAGTSSGSAPLIIAIPLNDKSEYAITQKLIDEWKALYPAVDILQELRKMVGWSNANPQKKKTRKGVARFINGWLAKEQDRGRRAGNQPSNSQYKEIELWT